MQFSFTLVFYLRIFLRFMLFVLYIYIYISKKVLYYNFIKNIIYIVKI